MPGLLQLLKDMACVFYKMFPSWKQYDVNFYSYVFTSRIECVLQEINYSVGDYLVERNIRQNTYGNCTLIYSFKYNIFLTAINSSKQLDFHGKT